VKIKEFSVTWYGPLLPSGRVVLTDFNLFWGKNEDGKTLTIEALIKLLLGKKAKYFENMDRVEANAEGYVIIKSDEGREFKLPEEGNLADLTGLTSLLCRNIFIIRNSDLSLERESEFYTKLTDRLTGLRTEKIAEIKKKLQEIGRLTRADSQADLSDSQDFAKIKSRLGEAKKLIERIETLEKEVKEKNYDRLEEKQVELEENIEKLNLYLEDLEKARKREDYEKSKKALEKLKQAIAEIKDLEVFNEENEQVWRDSQIVINNRSAEKDRLLQELAQQKQELKTVEKELREKKKKFQILKDRKKKLDEIKPQLANYRIKKENLSLKEAKNKMVLLWAVMAALLTGISFVGLIFQPLLIFYFSGVVFGLGTLILWGYYFNFIRNKALLSKKLEELKIEAARFGLDVGNIGQILFSLLKFEEGYEIISNEVQELETSKKSLKNNIDKLQHRNIPEIEAKIGQAHEKIDELKLKSGMENLSRYSEKLKIKQKQISILASQKSVLENFFEAKHTLLEKNISYWEKEIQGLEKYKDQARNIKYEERKVTELREKMEAARESLKEIKEKLISIQKELAEIERNANGILQLDEEYLYCQTSVDLEAVKNRLLKFISENETRKEAARAALSIFEEIEKEEREKVAQLFGGQSPVSAYFKEITGGLYQEVNFNHENSRIEVKLKNGLVLGTKKLSAGAYDQLYFSIRD